MPQKWNKKILTVLMQWDHGDKARGLSGDVTCFYNNFARLAESVEPFWFDAYISDPRGAGEALLAKAAEYKPDLIFFLPYTDQFSAEALDALKAKWTTCAWFGDDTWRFESYTSKIAPHYTFPITTDHFSVAKYKALGMKPVLSQWAAQLSGADLGPLPPETYPHKVSFVGGTNKYRVWFIGKLRELGVEVECFGHGWPAGKVSFEEMDRIFRGSLINLNLSNSINQDIRFVLSDWKNLVSYFRSPKQSEQIKARNFEIPLAGGFQLTNYVAGLERYLKIGEEVAAFSSPEECALQVKYYLENEAERRAILLASSKRVEKEHTYVARVEKILEEIWR